MLCDIVWPSDFYSRLVLYPLHIAEVEVILTTRVPYLLLGF
jgi:hypothetical protein